MSTTSSSNESIISNDIVMNLSGMEGRLLVENLFITNANRAFVVKFRRIVNEMVYGDDAAVVADPNGLTPALPIISYSATILINELSVELFATRDMMQRVEARLWASTATMREVNTMLFTLGYALSFENGLINCYFVRATLAWPVPMMNDRVTMSALMNALGRVETQLLKLARLSTWTAGHAYGNSLAAEVFELSSLPLGPIARAFKLTGDSSEKAELCFLLTAKGPIMEVDIHERSLVHPAVRLGTEEMISCGFLSEIAKYTPTCRNAWVFAVASDPFQALFIERQLARDEAQVPDQYDVMRCRTMRYSVVRTIVTMWYEYVMVPMRGVDSGASCVCTSATYTPTGIRHICRRLDQRSTSPTGTCRLLALRMRVSFRMTL